MKTLVLLLAFFAAGCVAPAGWSPAMYNAPGIGAQPTTRVVASSSPCKLELRGEKVAVVFDREYIHREQMLATVNGFIRLSGGRPYHRGGGGHVRGKTLTMSVSAVSEWTGSGAVFSTTIHLVKRGADVADGVGEAYLDQSYSNGGYGYPAYSAGYAFFGPAGSGGVYSSTNDAVMAATNEALRVMCEGQKGGTVP